jgi:hypothetical protein
LALPWQVPALQPDFASTAITSLRKLMAFAGSAARDVKATKSVKAASQKLESQR